MKTKTILLKSELSGIFRQIFKDYGINPMDCDEKAQLAAERLSSLFAGNRVYFPRGKTEQRERDEKIYAAHIYGQLPVAVIAKHEGLHRTSVYEIIEKMRAELNQKSA